MPVEPLFKRDVNDLLPEAYSYTASLLHAMMIDRASPYFERPRSGFGRGIEYYKGLQFFHVLAGSVASYASGVGRWPDLMKPALFSEKLVWLKFFQFLPIPTPSDKLMARNSIPAAYKDRIRASRILWQSPEPRLPPDGAVPPGYHFLKINNASGSNRRVQFPLAAQDKATLQPWLRSAFGYPQITTGGEWWYGTIRPQVFVEEAVGGTERPQEWGFFVMNGVCQFLWHHRDRTTGTRKDTLYDRDFNYLPIQLRDVEIGPVVPPPAGHALMLAAAEAIGSRLNFARIDFYQTTDGEIYLGEITLCPNNAVYWFSDPDFDARIGRSWTLGTI